MYTIHGYTVSITVYESIYCLCVCIVYVSILSKCLYTVYMSILTTCLCVYTVYAVYVYVSSILCMCHHRYYTYNRDWQRTTKYLFSVTHARFTKNWKMGGNYIKEYVTNVLLKHSLCVLIQATIQFVYI